MNPPTLPFNRLTVIGLGLIGGSLAMAVRERFPDWHIRGVDPDAEALQYALKNQVIDEASLTLPTLWVGNHLVVLAAHVSQNLEILTALGPQVVGEDIVLTDMGSCKREIAELGQTILPEQFIAGHPMAGKEFSGIAHATPLLFANKTFLFCPHAETPGPLVETMKTFAQALGAMPRLIDSDRHDRYMAYVSHFPQLYTLLLTNLLYRHEPGHLLAYHGGGLDDQLRLAASSFDMWGDVFNRNADHLSEVLLEMKAMIDEMLPLLRPEPTTQTKGEASEALRSWFERANEVHRQFYARKTFL